MAESKFVYVTYIRASADKVWDALTKPEFTRQYWFRAHPESDWKPGSSWKLLFPDGRLADSGEIVEATRPKRLVIKWRHEMTPEMKAEGYSRCTMVLEPDGKTTKLTITHEMDKKDSKFIGAVSNGWPMVLSGLKTLLETGESLVIPDKSG